MLQDELASVLGIKKSQLSKWKAKGCPVDDVGKAKGWISANVRARRKRTQLAGDAKTMPSTALPPRESPAPAECFSWEARLARARQMELDIYNAAQAAVGREHFSQLQSLLASYQRSLQGIADAEKTALEVRVQSGELIHRDTARAIMAELLVPIRNALDVLPMTERSRCNPQQPEVAEVALRAWKNALLVRLSQAKTRF